MSVWLSAEKNVEVGKYIFNSDSIPELKKVLENKCPKSPIIKRTLVENTGIYELAREILQKYRNCSAIVKKAYLLLLSGRLLELCELYDRLSDNGMVCAVLDYCRNNYRQHITLQSTADALFISRSYLSHIFCEKIKINFRDYINMLRINDAQSMLENGGISITETAVQCGFGSIRTFNRTFLKYIGMSPGEYAKRR